MKIKLADTHIATIISIDGRNSLFLTTSNVKFDENSDFKLIGVYNFSTGELEFHNLDLEVGVIGGLL